MTLKSFLKSFIREAILLILLIVLFNNYIGNPNQYIFSDGMGYYDYLPSAFIHDDFIRHKAPESENTNLYYRITEFAQGYIEQGDFRVNKYACGTAILQFPFFYSALITYKSNEQITGYEMPFHRAVFHATIFYLFLALIFVRKFLSSYNISDIVIFIIQALIVFATPVVYYANESASYSHIYSLFSISGFLYFSKNYFTNLRSRDFLLASIFFGLVFILRNVNILILVLLPFIAGSFANLKWVILHTISKPAILIWGLILALLIASIQSYVWFLQSGQFILYSYGEEGFRFLDPEFYRILFSYQKGLFVWTPITFISICSILYWLVKRSYFEFFTWLIFFVTVTYVLSSWWCWDYGSSFGMRVYIDFYAILFLPLAIVLDKLKPIFKTPLVVICLATIPVNIIQVYQYKKYILKWNYTTEQDYWKVFLKQEKSLSGYLWKYELDMKKYETLLDTNFGDHQIPNDTIILIASLHSSEVEEWSNITEVRVELENDFKLDRPAKLTLCIGDLRRDYCDFYWESHLIHYCDGPFGQYQNGNFNFDIEPFDSDEEKLITLIIRSDDFPAEINNLRLLFLKEIH